MTNVFDAHWIYELRRTVSVEAGGTFGPITGNSKLLQTLVRNANKRTWKTFGLPRYLPKAPTPPKLPSAASRSAARHQIFNALEEARTQRIVITRDDGQQDTVFGRVVTPNGLDDVMLTDRFVNHLIDDHLKQTREQFANLILPSLNNPAEVWLQPHLIRDRIVYRQAFITAFEGRSTIVIVQEDRHRSLTWTFFPRHTTRGVRWGYLLYRCE